MEDYRYDGRNEWRIVGMMEGMNGGLEVLKVGIAQYTKYYQYM